MRIATFALVVSCFVALVALLLASSSLVSARGFFYQIICQDSSCSVDCQYTLFEEDVCYVMSNGYSGFGQCVNSRTALIQQNYAFSDNCTGLYTDDELTSGECYPSGTNGNEYVKFNCNTAGGEKHHHRHEEKKSGAVVAVVEEPPKLHRVAVRKNNSPVLRFGKKN